jgi:DNA-binding LacI/PurR family transcriptional regulator
MLLVKSEPLYLKLKRNLKELIEVQDLAVLPGARELEKGYGVSRITVRRAIAELVKEGIVTSTQGRKVMVTKHLHSTIKELGFVISETSPWSQNIFSYFANTALNKNCNFNMFVCGTSNDITKNSSFNYLFDSNKFSGLLLMNRLSFENIEFLLKKKISLLTYGFKYREYGIPAALFSYESAFSQMVDYYLKQNINRFGFISFYEDDDDPAYGEGRIFIEDYKKVIKKRGLVDYNIPELFKDNKTREELTLEAIKHLHALPSEQRPQVIVSYYFDISQTAKLYLNEIDDWSPLHIYSKNKDKSIPGLICSYKKLVEASFEEFADKINKSENLKDDILIQVEFDLGYNN